MSINNELINDTLAKLSKRKAELNKDKNELQEYTRILSELITGNDDVLPKDSKTGEIMNRERRDQIFNSVVKRATKYLGSN